MQRKTVNLYHDFVDELNFKWTGGLLLVIVVTIGVLRYVFLSSLITCWIPPQFTENHEDFAQQICWSTDRVYIPSTDPMPIRQKPQQAYHSKIPIILTLMLLGFQLPRLFKHLGGVFFGRSAILIQDIFSIEARERQINQLAEILRDTSDQGNCLRTVLLLITKFLICINLLIQLVFVSTYFKDSVELVEESNVTISHPVYMFPHMIICDFSIRRLSNLDAHTVQCLMPVNFLYENFLYYWWYWIVGVGVVSVLMFVLQFASIYIPPFMQLRFRGIIPREYLSVRVCSLTDDVLMLTDIMNSSGQAMAREVAMRAWGTQPRHSTLGESKSVPASEHEMLIMHDK